MSTPDRIGIRITSDALSLAEVDGLLRPAGDSSVGAVVLFTGVVRGQEPDGPIGHLDYEAYEAMALAESRRIAEEAITRWGLRAAVVHHRVGRVPVGEDSVIVGASAAHRAEAFEGARHLIDEVKARAAIWKTPPRRE